MPSFSTGFKLECVSIIMPSCITCFKVEYLNIIIPSWATCAIVIMRSCIPVFDLNVLLSLCIPSCSTCFSLECGIVNMPSPCLFPASMCDCHYEFMFLTWMHYCHDAFMSSMVWGFIPIRWGIGVPIDKTTWSRSNPNSNPNPYPNPNPM